MFNENIQLKKGEIFYRKLWDFSYNVIIKSLSKSS